MAIDTSMYVKNLPIGTYTKGDVIPLVNFRGPAIVRDGYGDAFLKRIMCGQSSGASTARVPGHIVVKNSNWVDEVANMAAPATAITLAETSSNIQRGHDCKLTRNSGWEVKFIVDETVTTTAANDLFCLIDIDYPSVQAVKDPRSAPGTPVTIVRDDTVTTIARGTIESGVWTSFNVDILKAGFRYLLTELGIFTTTATGGVGFVSISQAAGQQGLERIIPAIADLTFMRYLLDYSTPLVKGPMNINYLIIAATAASTPVTTELDWVKA